MKRRLFIGAGTLGVLLAAGTLAWWRLRPEPAPASAERTFEQISLDEHKKWMEDLGYYDGLGVPAAATKANP